MRTIEELKNYKGRKIHTRFGVGVKYIIHTQPATDVKPVVRGEWIDDNPYTIPKCSICGKRIHSGEWNEENNYCGHCGADMRKDKE